jgi:hypothetical protein
MAYFLGIKGLKPLDKKSEDILWIDVEADLTKIQKPQLHIGGLENTQNVAVRVCEPRTDAWPQLRDAS